MVSDTVTTVFEMSYSSIGDNADQTRMVDP